MQSPTGSGRCEACREAHGHRGSRITTYPNGVHNRCRTASFTHDDLLDGLRTLARSLSAASRETVALGKQLRELASRWPPRDPAELDRLHEQRSRWRQAPDELKRLLR